MPVRLERRGIIRLLHRFQLFALILLFPLVFPCLAPAAGFSPVPLIADPHVNLHRVKAVQPTDRLMAAEAQTSTITVNYLPAGPDPHGVGDSCATWPAAAQAAFSYAAGIWQSKLNSPVPVVIDACWATNLPAGVLGHAGPLGFYSNFPNAPQANTEYAVALANSLSGTDRDPATSDIYIAFSSTFSWYFGTDGNTPGNAYDLVSVVLHETAHGLGFLGSMAVSGGIGSWGFSNGNPLIYDRFTRNGAGQSLLNTTLFPNPSTALAAQLTGNNLFFNGANANAANGGSPARIYAPAAWSDGSSYSHLDEIYNNTPNALMTFSLFFGESIHDPGPVAIGILKDIGWQLGLPPRLTVSIIGNGSVNSDAQPGIACTTGNSGVCSAQFASGTSLTLTATGVASQTLLSHFGSWTGGCDSTSGANCTVTMNTDKNITAAFITNQPAHIPGGGYFDSLQAAYNASGPGSVIIQAQRVLLPIAGFTLNNGKSVTLECGFDSPYSSNSGGFTTMNGVLTIQTGSLTVENLIIR